MPETKPTIAAIPELAEEFAQRAATLALRAIEQRRRFALAIPGGSVATAFLPVLAAARIDWPRADLFWCDERCVPRDDAASNYALARSVWLGGAPADAPRVHPLPGDSNDPLRGAQEAAGELERTLGTPPVLDLVLLGVGEDGHVASLFPRHPALEDDAIPVVLVTDAPKPPACRLTMTLSILTRARSVCIAAFGSAKAEAMASALEDPLSDLPVSRVLRSACDVRILLDPPAASRLRRR